MLFSSTEKQYTVQKWFVQAPSAAVNLVMAYLAPIESSKIRIFCFPTFFKCFSNLGEFCYNIPKAGKNSIVIFCTTCAPCYLCSTLQVHSASPKRQINHREIIIHFWDHFLHLNFFCTTP